MLLFPRILSESERVGLLDDAESLWVTGYCYFCAIHRRKWNSEMAMVCFSKAAEKGHADAIWFTKKVEEAGGLPAGLVSNKYGTLPRVRHPLDAFLSNDMDDPRALFLLGCYCERYEWDRDTDFLLRSAKMGYAPAMVELALEMDSDSHSEEEEESSEQKMWIQRAACTGNVAALLIQARNSKDAKQLNLAARRAVESGWQNALFTMIDLCESSPERIYWLCRATAENAFPFTTLCQTLSKEVKRYRKAVERGEPAPKKLVIVWGSCLYGHYNEAKQSYFDNDLKCMDEWDENIRFCISTYVEFMGKLSLRVVSWLLIGKKLVGKDVANLIANLVWNEEMNEIRKI